MHTQKLITGYPVPRSEQTGLPRLVQTSRSLSRLSTFCLLRQSSDHRSLQSKPIELAPMRDLGRYNEKADAKFRISSDRIGQDS